MCRNVHQIGPHLVESVLLHPSNLDFRKINPCSGHRVEHWVVDILHIHRSHNLLQDGRGSVLVESHHSCKELVWSPFNHPLLTNALTSSLGRWRFKPPSFFRRVQSYELSLSNVHIIGHLLKRPLIQLSTFHKPIHIAVKFQNNGIDAWLTIEVPPTNDKCGVLQFLSFLSTLFVRE